MAIKRTLCALVAMLAAMGMEAKSVTVAPFSIAPGETRCFAIDFANTKSVHVAFQADIHLPDGLTLNADACYLSDRIADGTQPLYIGQQSDGTYRLLTTSYSLTPIAGNSGALVYVSVTASNDYAGGSIVVDNAISVDSSSNRYSLGTETATASRSGYVWGDVNQDGTVDTADMMFVVHAITHTDSPVYKQADINGDGTVDQDDCRQLEQIISKNQ